jgi:hypothetical protein
VVAAGWGCGCGAWGVAFVAAGAPDPPMSVPGTGEGCELSPAEAAPAGEALASSAWNVVDGGAAGADAVRATGADAVRATGADAVRATAPPALASAAVLEPPSPSTGASNSDAHVRTSIAPVSASPWLCWNCHTAARVSGP